MFREKCQDEQTEQYIVEYLNNIGSSLDLCLKYDTPELEKMLLKKWTDGKRCQNAFTRLYKSSRRVVKRMKDDDDWSDEQEAEY